jgi:hypothetical protein
MWQAGWRKTQKLPSLSAIKTNFSGYAKNRWGVIKKRKREI